MVHPSGQPNPLDTLWQRFSGLQLVGQNPVAELYAGTDAGGAPVSVALLREQAAADPAVRGGFAAAVNRNSYAQQPGDVAVHAANLSAARPWAAMYQRPGQPGAERLLAGLPGGPIVPVPAAAAPAFAAGTVAPPQRSLSTGARVALIAAGVVVLLAAAVGVFFLGGTFAGDQDPIADRTTPPVVKPSHTGGQPPPAPSGSGGATPEPGKPQLRDVTPVTVVGPSFADGEDTYTMQFDGWPFAFRTPRSWGCLGGKTQVPNAKAWGCIDEQHSGDRQRVNIILRPCPTTCTAAEQVQMNRAWLDDPEKAEVVRQRTYYVVTPNNSKGLYSIDSSHFFSGSDDPADRVLHWQVGVFVESPASTKDEVLKILNDVVTQAG